MKTTARLQYETARKAEKFQRVMQEQHQALFRYYALHTNGELSTAYELTVATFELLYRRYDSFETADFPSELFGAAWDLLNAHYSRKEGNTRQPKSHFETALEPALARMFQGLRRLPFYPREIFYLRFFTGLSVREISLLMDKNETTVQVIVYQTMLKFASKNPDIDLQLVSWKQLVVFARAYHRYLEDVLVGVQPEEVISEDAVRATRQLEALRESMSMTPEMFAALRADVARTIQQMQPAINPL